MFNITEQSLKVRTVTVVTAESFIFILSEDIIFGQPQLIDGIIAALFELNADTVALVGDTGFPCINGYLPGIFFISSSSILQIWGEPKPAPVFYF